MKRMWGRGVMAGPLWGGAFFSAIQMSTCMHGRVGLGWRQVANSHWTPNLCVQ
jgi:hypothetical protein